MLWMLTGLLMMSECVVDVNRIAMMSVDVNRIDMKR